MLIFMAVFISSFFFFLFFFFPQTLKPQAFLGGKQQGTSFFIDNSWFISTSNYKFRKMLCSQMHVGEDAKVVPKHNLTMLPYKTPSFSQIQKKPILACIAKSSVKN